MNYVMLKEVCSINMGQSPDSNSYNEIGEGVPFFQGNADFGERYPVVRKWCTAPTKMAKPEDILISVRAPIGAMNYAKEDCCIGRGLVALTPDKSKVSPEFIFWLLKGKNGELNSKGTGSTFKAIGRKVLEETLVPNIDLTTQIKCSASLEKVYSIIQYRKQQLQQLDDLVKARFVEMFGDPMTNSKGYVLKKYGDLFELNAGGTPSKQKSEYWDNGTISWIGSNMCQNAVIYENDGNYITEEGLKHSSARIFPVDTVLIALVGATIGKTALLKFETTTNQNVLGVRGIRERGYAPEFIFYYTQGLYQKFLNIGDGGFAMASKGFISELPVPIVGLTIQEKFATFVEQTDKSKFVVQKALDEAQTLFDSLMQEYFG